ncbi:MAG: hypothetical protein HYU62_00380 [Caulobacterales bacterium]|nr:hypothetical protein [Caulobacterales bacterium]
MVILAGLFAFIWAQPVTAGGLEAFLVTEAQPGRWVMAALCSPLILWIVIRQAWVAARWRARAIYVQDERLWLATRWSPVPFNGVVEVGLTDRISVAGMTFLPQALLLKRPGKRDQRLALGYTKEPADEIAARLRECLRPA